MYAIYLALLIAGATCLFLTAIEEHWRKATDIRPPRINLLALGLLLWILVPLIQLART